MRPFRFTQKPAPALLAGTGAVTAVTVLTTVALVLIGLPPTATPAPAAPQKDAQAVTAAWAPSPATAALTAALNQPPAGWSVQGDLQRLVTPPVPYSCPQAGTAASVSLARSFTFGGVRFQVTVLAYTAGIGAEAAERQAANAYLCAGPETGLSLWGIDGPGRDARHAVTSRGGIRASVVSFRRGDVMVYVTGNPTAPLQDLAAAFDGALTGRLKNVCVNQDSTTGDAARTPWSAAGYRPYTEEAKVSIPPVPLPDTTPAPTASPSPTASVTATPSPRPTVERVPLPGPDLVERVAEPKDQPPFPVAPAMPEPVARPEAPEAPPAEAVTEKVLQVPAEDAAGPGCGWAFTGMKPLPFDAVATEAARSTLLEKARTGLESGAKTWQSSILAYWSSYARYRKAAEAYNAYADRVDEVNRAWTVTEKAWEQYDEAVADRSRLLQERDAFRARQDKARKAYEAAAKRCDDAPAPAPSPSASPAPTSSPSPEPTASPSPAPTPLAGCPVERPAILDESAPAVPPAPTKPANPSAGE